MDIYEQQEPSNTHANRTQELSDISGDDAVFDGDQVYLEDGPSDYSDQDEERGIQTPHHESADPFTTSRFPNGNSRSSHKFAGDSGVTNHATGPSHGYDRSFSTTTAIHLDEHVNPHISDDEEDDVRVYGEPFPGFEDRENAPPSLEHLKGLSGAISDTRKASDGVSTLPDELEYYRSPIPTRSPLSSSYSYDQQMGSRHGSALRDDSISSRSHQGPYASPHFRAAGRPSSIPSTSHRQQEYHSSPLQTRTSSGRPVFRNPSSVRAMQLSSPSPPPFAASPLSGRQYRRQQSLLSRDDRARSHSPLTNQPRSRGSTPHHSVSSPRQHLNPRKEYPLVLLHCTIGPLKFPLNCPAAVLEEAGCPERMRRDLALIDEKLNSTIVERGILIPHPGEDYDVLEERVLESLELKKPRIGACGHFRSSSGDVPSYKSHNRGIRLTDVASGIDEDQLPKCSDCSRHINPELFDDKTQLELRRWEVRVYAANGLMRAGAWSAAWSQMEKVDVEVEVWMPPDVRRRLELIASANVHESALQEVPSRLEETCTDHESERSYSEAASREKGQPASFKAPSVAAAAKPASTAACSRRASSSSTHGIHLGGVDRPGSSRRKYAHQLPLSTLLFNYLCARREIVFAVTIGVVAITLAFRSLLFAPKAHDTYEQDSLATAGSDRLMVRSPGHAQECLLSKHHNVPNEQVNPSSSTCDLDIENMLEQLKTVACKLAPNASADQNQPVDMTAVSREVVMKAMEEHTKDSSRSEQGSSLDELETATELPTPAPVTEDASESRPSEPSATSIHGQYGCKSGDLEEIVAGHASSARGDQSLPHT